MGNAETVWQKLFVTLRQRWEGFEPRPGQRELASAVAAVLEQGGHLLAEAGTGTGKSLAYLVPLLSHLQSSSEKAVVSTGTIALQEQILRQDIPRLAALLSRPVEVVLVKGKRNYLCHWRLTRELEALPARFREDGWPQLLAWAEQTATGDGAEIEGKVAPTIWARVAADETCLRPYCPYQDRCFFLRAREQAQKAQLLIANHHLYLSDLALRLSSDHEAAVLPEHAIAVFDEAHHLPDVASATLAVEVSPGAIATLTRSLHLLRLPGWEVRTGQEVEQAAAVFFASLTPASGEEEEAWPLTAYPAELAEGLLTALRRLSLQIRDLPLEGVDLPRREAAARLAETADRLAENLSFILRREPGYVSWVRAEVEGARRRVSLVATPLEIGELLAEHLFGPLRATVLTSATLSVAGDFRFFRREVGLSGGAELRVGSPFSYREQCLLYTPADLPDPNHPEYYGLAAARIEELLALSRGRALVLFTSFRGLNTVYDYLRPRLSYPLYRQGELPRHHLLARFREEVSSVLLATASFWEGIDVPGETLSCLIIDRLPFEVPSHPVTRARLEQLRSAGGNPFWQYSLPRAVLRLTQGFGRLIRQRGDRGVVAILDPRLSSRTYGRRFLEALPSCPRTDRLEDVRRFFEEGGTYNQAQP
ncbi:MAG: ATP-dependent DNA helicase [Moorellales bacterium]